LALKLVIKRLGVDILEFSVSGATYLREIQIFAKEGSGEWYGAGGVYPVADGSAVWEVVYPERDQSLSFYVVNSANGEQSNTVTIIVGANVNGWLVVGGLAAGLLLLWWFGR